MQLTLVDACFFNTSDCTQVLEIVRCCEKNIYRVIWFVYACL